MLGNLIFAQRRNLNFRKKRLWSKKLKIEGETQNTCKRLVQMKKNVLSKPFPSCPLLLNLTYSAQSRFTVWPFNLHFQIIKVKDSGECPR